MPPQSEANSVATSNPLSENITNVDGGDVESAFSSAAAATPQKPVKKPTRQWAAWTRQEEENFFNALRQVGKNFEKITCRVQSKNKEQVRHYYYRLVRRMNKLLGPGFCLDAKNSKDTNAAMLRWWSLLEKYSCTASKLHLKPRRFKTFIETLAQQLLKDRNRTRRKRPYQGESGPIPMTVESMFNKPSGHDVHMVKLVFVDAQNSPKLGSTKLSSKRVNVSKGEGPVTKVTNQRRRAACGAAASAYKKWEKAAIAGVSLVADAAEHLERASIDKNGSNVDVTSEILPADGCITDAAGSIDCAQPPESSTPEEPQCKQSIDEINSQPPTKLKLQLFPIDEPTRKALEKDDRNPHLELTLSARKRISSILEHLSRKWGDSSVASGELMLFPYSAQQDNLAYSPRWTLKDSSASAGDVYTTVGSPTVFRLRYGWFSSLEDQSAKKDPLNSTSAGTAAEDDRDGHKQRQVGGVTTTMSAGEWADSLTNISVGDLLSEASRAQDVRPNGSAWSGISLSCDSFDAAIAGFISGHQGSSLSPPLASILDAEETCDEFSFPRALSAGSSGMGFAKESTAVVEQFGERAGPSEYAQASNYKADPAKTNELMDFYWPDSLGPLDLDVPPARYQGQDLLFGDAGGSLGGLTRLIASSLDAFQNCSFFAPEKESHAVGGMQGAASDS